ncbi:MAG: hypothetical protein IAG10_26585 [Planctomycetaceae bacterium]|nr:hypothetical protein [Planctomycetaceae bacterium]
MRLRMFVAVVVSASLWSMSGAVQAESKLEAVAALPDGLSKEIAAIVDAKGQKVVGKDGAVCSVWLVKEVPMKANFKPTLNVKYPFAPGELIGVLQVQAKSKYTDFRGQEIKPGVFTLRYGQQPEDGNHVGTSDLADFLLAIPAAVDTDPNPIAAFKALSERSAKTSGSTHPAIFSLLPGEKPVEKPTLTHDGDKDHTMLSTVLSAKGGTKVALRMVVIGKSGE